MSFRGTLSRKATGHLTITFNYVNRMAVNQTVDDKEVTLYQPFTVISGLMLDNDRADAFLQAAEAVLPAGVRVTVYDQGYAEAAQPLRLMLRTVSMIALVCVAAGLCFLLLNLWLFVSRQRSVGTLTLRLGAPRSAAPLYFLSAMLALALPGQNPLRVSLPGKGRILFRPDSHALCYGIWTQVMGMVALPCRSLYAV